MSAKSRDNASEKSAELTHAGTKKKEEYVPLYRKRTLPDWIKLR